MLEVLLVTVSEADRQFGVEVDVRWLAFSPLQREIVDFTFVFPPVSIPLDVSAFVAQVTVSSS